MIEKNQPYGPNYRRLRRDVMKRNGGICAFNGLEKATECHHGMILYPDHADLTADNLVQLSKSSHDLATAIRQFQWRLNAEPKNVVGVLLDFMATETFLDQLKQTVTPKPIRIRPIRDQAGRQGRTTRVTVDVAIEDRCYRQIDHNPFKPIELKKSC